MDVTEQDIKIAGINAEYKAMHDYFETKGEKTNLKLKEYAKFEKWYLLIWTYFAAFVLGWDITLRLGVIVQSDTTIRIFHDASIIVSFFSACIIVYALSKAYILDALETDLAHVPVAFVGVCSIVIIVALPAFFESDFIMPAQVLLWVGLILVGYAIVEVEKRTIELDKIKKEAKEKAEQELKTAASEGRVKEIHRCSVCQQESIYDLCLTCEETYRAERHRIRNQILRAKKANVEATLTLVQWLTTLSNFHWKCAYCQTGPYQVMEHYVPVSQGGGTTAENCVPACFKCNSEKASKHPEEEQDEWEYMAKATPKQQPVVKRTSRK